MGFELAIFDFVSKSVLLPEIHVHASKSLLKGKRLIYDGSPMLKCDPITQ